jgi:hypothetical protein
VWCFGRVDNTCSSGYTGATSHASLAFWGVSISKSEEEEAEKQEERKRKIFELKDVLQRKANKGKKKDKDGSETTVHISSCKQ